MLCHSMYNSISSETCGADVVVGVDMQNFNKDKKELVSHFIDHLTDQLNVGLSFNSDVRNSARLSLFGFADSDPSANILHPLTFEMFATDTVKEFEIILLCTGIIIIFCSE